MALKDKMKPFMSLGFLLWGISLGIRYDAIWDAIGLIILSYAIYKAK